MSKVGMNFIPGRGAIKLTACLVVDKIRYAMAVLGLGVAVVWLLLLAIIYALQIELSE